MAAAIVRDDEAVANMVKMIRSDDVRRGNRDADDVMGDRRERTKSYVGVKKCSNLDWWAMGSLPETWRDVSETDDANVSPPFLSYATTPECQRRRRLAVWLSCHSVTFAFHFSVIDVVDTFCEANISTFDMMIP